MLVSGSLTQPYKFTINYMTTRGDIKQLPEASAPTIIYLPR